MLAPTPQVSQDLLKAADIIRQRGLTKYALWDMTKGTARTAPVCARGAIFAAINGDGDAHYRGTIKDRWQAAEWAAIAVLKDRGVDVMVDPSGGIHLWNNAPERTAKEVIALFEETAAVAVNA